jgi:3-mercaptopyruvate sulfurtransferase SseA
MEVIMKKLKQVVTLTIFLSLVLAVNFGWAQTQKSAEPAQAAAAQDWKFHDIVDVEFVMQHVKIPQQADVMLIDARPKRAKYDKGHIPMAVSIPHTKFDKMVAKLPQNKNALLIYYCQGLK